MSRFGGLDAKLSAKAAEPTKAAPASASVESAAARPGRAKAREGKKPVIGYFSEDLSRELRMMSASEGRTMQALLGEAIDMLMIDRGKSRFGER